MMCASRRDPNLDRWDNDGGAPQAGRRSPARPTPTAPATPALYYFNIRSDRALLDDPEGSTLPDRTAAVEEALALARDSLAEGGRTGEDRRGWQVEIMDRANRHLMTVAFTKACVCEWPRPGEGA